MSPSCYPNKSWSLLLLVIPFLLYGFVSLNDRSSDFKPKFDNADAYFEYSYIDVSYIRVFGGFKRYISIEQKLVVNTSKGVEENAFLNLSEYEINHLDEISVRTLKANGTVVNLDSTEVFKRNSSKDDFPSIRYPIPAVEPGDTIETKYVFYEMLEKSELLKYVNLNSSVPSKNSQYTIRTKTGMSVRYKTYNGFPEPLAVSNDTILYLEFSMDSLKAINEHDYSCLNCELPYFYFTLEDEDSELRTWKDVYNEEFNVFTQPFDVDYEKSSYYKRWKRRVIDTEKDSSKFYKFKKFHNEILNTITIESPNPAEMLKSNGYFLKNNRFDEISIRRLYRQLLEELDIDYWAVFAKTKQRGEMDQVFIRKGEFDHVFFAYEDERGVFNFLYPHEELFMYQLGELPTTLYNTDAVMVKPYIEGKQKKKDKFITRDFELNEVDSVTVANVNLPGMDSDYNFINQVFSAKIDLETEETTFRSRFKASGGWSTEIRSFYNMQDQNQ